MAAVSVHRTYSASMARKIGHWTPGQRYAGFALLVDPTFALAELRGGERLSAGYYFGIAVPLYINWVAMTAVGALFGSLIRNPEAIGLDFVVPAYFIFLIVGFRKRPNAVPVILASAAGSVAAFLSAGPPWHYAGGALAGIAVAAAIGKPRRADA